MKEGIMWSRKEFGTVQPLARNYFEPVFENKYFSAHLLACTASGLKDKIIQKQR
jgi:hypothetical protein